MVGVTIVMLVAVTGFYYGARSALHGAGSSTGACGSKFMTCPETAKQALVGLAPGTISSGGCRVMDRLRIGECSLWPVHQECGQSCTKQMGAR